MADKHHPTASGYSAGPIRWPEREKHSQFVMTRNLVSEILGARHHMMSPSTRPLHVGNYKLLIIIDTNHQLMKVFEFIPRPRYDALRLFLQTALVLVSHSVLGTEIGRSFSTANLYTCSAVCVPYAVLRHNVHHPTLAKDYSASDLRKFIQSLWSASIATLRE